MYSWVAEDCDFNCFYFDIQADRMIDMGFAPQMESMYVVYHVFAVILLLCGRL
jgi:hypothetical protein